MIHSTFLVVEYALNSATATAKAFAGGEELKNKKVEKGKKKTQKWKGPLFMETSLSDFLHQLELTSFIPLLEGQNVTSLAVFAALEASHLLQLQLRVGDRVRFDNAIKKAKRVLELQRRKRGREEGEEEEGQGVKLNEQEEEEEEEEDSSGGSSDDSNEGGSGGSTSGGRRRREVILYGAKTPKKKISQTHSLSLQEGSTSGGSASVPKRTRSVALQVRAADPRSTSLYQAIASAVAGESGTYGQRLSGNKVKRPFVGVVFFWMFV